MVIIGLIVKLRLITEHYDHRAYYGNFSIGFLILEFFYSSYRLILDLMISTIFQNENDLQYGNNI